MGGACEACAGALPAEVPPPALGGGPPGPRLRLQLQPLLHERRAGELRRRVPVQRARGRPGVLRRGEARGVQSFSGLGPPGRWVLPVIETAFPRERHGPAEKLKRQEVSSPVNAARAINLGLVPPDSRSNGAPVSRIRSIAIQFTFVIVKAMCVRIQVSL